MDKQADQGAPWVSTLVASNPRAILGRRVRHAAALLGAVLACVRTALAVVYLVLATLRAAGFANVGADAAQLLGELRIPAHKGRGLPADSSTVVVQANTLCHFRNVALTQACIGTVLTSLSTFDARLDARLKFLMGHCRFLGVRAGKNSFQSQTASSAPRFNCVSVLRNSVTCRRSSYKDCSAPRGTALSRDE